MSTILDITLVVIIAAIAIWYLYNKFKKNSGCSCGPSSCCSYGAQKNHTPSDKCRNCDLTEKNIDMDGNK